MKLIEDVRLGAKLLFHVMGRLFISNRATRNREIGKYILLIFSKLHIIVPCKQKKENNKNMQTFSTLISSSLSFCSTSLIYSELS